MSFRRFFLVRLAWALLGLWAAATVVFVVFYVAIGDPVKRFCGGDQYVPGCVERVEDAYQLGSPRYEQYGVFLWRLVVHQSPGEEFVSGRDAGEPAREALPATLSLVVPALALAYGVAGLAGIALARARRRRIFDLPIYVAVGLSPIFVGLVLSYYLGFRWDLAPISGYCDFFNPPPPPPPDAFGPEVEQCGGAVDWATHLVLPAVTLSLYFAAVYTRVVRAVVVRIRSVKEPGERRELRRRYVLLLARAAGRDFGFAIGVALLVEVIFQIPGLGRGVVTSIYSQTFVDIQAYVLYGTFLAIAVHCLVDVIVGALDKQLRSEWPVARMPKPT